MGGLASTAGPELPAGGATAAAASAELGQCSSISSRAYSTVSETAILIPHGGDHDALRLDRIFRRITWRIMPLFLAVMILNHVDRTNLAFASLTMNADLHIGPATYGLGSALFFIPFCFLQVPSNLIVARLGVRRWLSFLLLAWGTVASCMALIHNVPSFFTLRVLLGVFEAGAVPAMWFHLSTFYTPDRITKPFTLLAIGILLAQAVSGPIAAGFLSMDGLGGLHGWQWLFLLEGLPTVVLSLVVLTCLPDSPAIVPWLSDSEKKLLEASFAEAARKPSLGAHPASVPAVHQPGRTQQQHLSDHGALKLLWQALCNPALMYLCLLGVLLSSASNTYVFFLPMIINALLYGQLKPAPGGHGASTGKLLPVILTCIPYTLAAVSSWFIAHSSQQRKELYFHTALPAIIGGVFFVLFPFLSRASMAAGFASLVLVAVSAACSLGPKTAIVHRVTVGPSQVVSMPLYNSIVVLGGFVGPFITGNIVQRTGNFAGVSVLYGVFLLTCGAALILLKYLLQWRDQRHARLHPCGNAAQVPASGFDAAAAAGVPQQAGCSSSSPVPVAADAAPVTDVGAVVLQSAKDVHVRPRPGAVAGCSRA